MKQCVALLPTTTIAYGLPAGADVRLEVFNMLGQRVAVLVSGKVDAGYHRVQLQNSDLASGVYIYMLRADRFVASRRLLLLKSRPAPGLWRVILWRVRPPPIRSPNL